LDYLDLFKNIFIIILNRLIDLNNNQLEYDKYLYEQIQIDEEIIFSKALNKINKK
jgi:hypothetical protein